MARQPTFLIVGMATRDTFIDLEGLHGGNESVRIVRSCTSRLGGKGYLVANAIRQVAGADPVLVSEVAEGGSEFSPNPGLLPILDHDSMVWVVTGADGDQRTYVKRGRRRVAIDNLRLRIRRHLEDSTSAYISTERADILRAFVEAHRTVRVTPPFLAVNPCNPLQDNLADDPEVLHYLMGVADLIVLNGDEWRRLNAVDPAVRDDAVLIVTGGARGGMYSIGGYHWSPFAAERVDDGLSAAGAGDVFNGCLLAHLADHRSLAESIAYASYAAAAYVKELRQALRGANREDHARQ